MESPTQPVDNMRRLPIWGFLVLVVVYLAIIQGVGILVRDVVAVEDGKLVEPDQVLVNMWIPIGLALLFVYGTVALLRWWDPVLRENHPVRRWLWAVPITFIAAILLGTNYPQLADNGLVFTIVLLIGTQMVGWGEEGMFRGIGVTALRQHGMTEGKVALWSSVIFGAVHLSNVIGRGAGAIPQAIMVSLAGYFFYLTRRVSKGNVLNSILHGLFDFAILSSTGIALDDSIYPGGLLPLLVYPVLAIVLFVRRHQIEPADEAMQPAA